MLRKKLLCGLLTIAVFLVLMSLSGCQIKFKGTDVDYEGSITKTYVFDGVELACGKDSQ